MNAYLSAVELTYQIFSQVSSVLRSVLQTFKILGFASWANKVLPTSIPKDVQRELEVQGGLQAHRPSENNPGTSQITQQSLREDRDASSHKTITYSETPASGITSTSTYIPYIPRILAGHGPNNPTCYFATAGGTRSISHIHSNLLRGSPRTQEYVDILHFAPAWS